MQALAATLALDVGDVVTATRWVAAHGRWLDWSGAVLWRADHELLRACLAQSTGERAAARTYAEQALADASEPRQPLTLLATHRLLGELDIADGRQAEATAHLDAALALADACAAPYERALTLLGLAEVRLVIDDLAGSRSALDAARVILAPLEARPALARADRLAERLDAAAPPPAAALPGGLSPREAEVLRLLASGRSTQQIAEALFLSPRTVKRHIANLYVKIDAHGRAEATAYALRHHLA
jgi:DNA-binding CsgD family transcriptional regulator